MKEGRQDSPISTDEHSQDLESDLGGQNKTNQAKGSNALVWVAKFGLIILLLCAVVPIAGFALFAIIVSGGAPEIVEAAVTFGVILLLVLLAIMGSKKWGLTFGGIALLVLLVAMTSFFG